MSLLEKLGVGFFIGTWIVVILGVIGWFMNVYKLIKLDFNTPYKAEVIRGVGLFPIVGAVTGWIDIED